MVRGTEGPRQVLNHGRRRTQNFVFDPLLTQLSVGPRDFGGWMKTEYVNRHPPLSLYTVSPTVDGTSVPKSWNRDSLGLLGDKTPDTRRNILQLVVGLKMKHLRSSCDDVGSTLSTFIEVYNGLPRSPRLSGTNLRTKETLSLTHSRETPDRRRWNPIRL